MVGEDLGRAAEVGLVRSVYDCRARVVVPLLERHCPGVDAALDGVLLGVEEQAHSFCL